jgi:hypothetical protein
VIRPILNTLLSISRVLNKILGVASKVLITLPFFGFFWLRSVRSSFVREKKAASEPETKADPTKRRRSTSPSIKK